MLKSSTTAGAIRFRRTLSRSTSLASVLLVCALIVASIAPAAAATPTVRPAPISASPYVVIYGDSIVHSAGPFVRLALARYGITLIDASVGGTAPCDALQFVASDMARYDPRLVVIAYVGNSFSPCINGTQGEAVYVRHYLDTQRLVTAIGRRPLVFDTPPGEVGQGPYTAYDVLVHVEASTWNARIAPTSEALVDPATQRFEKSMPCTVTTVCNRIDVRGADGYHLNFAGGYLYSQALVRTILKRLHIPSRETKSLF